MKTFLWGVIREAILSGSPEAIKYAAELLANKLPFTAERLTQFLTACLEAAIRFGDQWVNTLASSMLAPLAFAAGPDSVGCNEPDCPHEVAEFAPLIAEFRMVA